MKHLTVLALLLPVLASAQINSGARITALGGAGVALKDFWSIQKNQAGLSNITDPTISFNYEQRLLSEDVASQSVVLVVPVNRNVLAVSFQRYGFFAFNQQKGSFAYARTFGPNLAAGISINYHQLKITNYGSSNAISAEAGFQYRPTKHLTFGAHVANPSNNSYSADVSSDLPIAISVGTAYQFSEKVLLSAELEKVIHYDLNPRIGLEYTLIHWLALRAGVSTTPFQQHAGFGLSYKSFQFDSTISSHSSTGYSPQIGIAYAF